MGAAMKAVMKPAMKAAMKPAMKAAMKAMKKGAMKAAMKKAMKKVMKKKKVSKIAKGKNAKAAGGLTASGLTKNKGGRVVSKAASARAKKNYQSSSIKVWADAVKKARKALGLTGFVAIGGKTAAGKALYAKAKSLLEV